MVPRGAAARGGSAASQGRRGLLSEGDDEKSCSPAGTVGLLGPAQALHRADHPRGEENCFSKWWDSFSESAWGGTTALAVD